MLLDAEINMDPREKATLQHCRNCFMEDLDPTMSLLSQLQVSGIITEDNRDRIDKQTTRQDKVITLLDILPRRGPRAFRKFVSTLRQDYSWISERLEAEYQVQDYTKRIENALEQRTKRQGELIKDKDYINKVITETVVPFILDEVGSSTSRKNNNGPSFDTAIKNIINDHLLPLVRGNGAHRFNLEQMKSGELLEKAVDTIEELRLSCCKSLGLIEGMEFHTSLSKLIDVRFQEVRDEVSVARKENRKVKKSEDKLTAEVQKLKQDMSTLKTELKRARGEVTTGKSESKKLKDQIQKGKNDNEKLKQEIKSLREQMSKAGIDLQISQDFCS